jgi:hypothetical protein
MIMDYYDLDRSTNLKQSVRVGLVPEKYYDRATDDG